MANLLHIQRCVITGGGGGNCVIHEYRDPGTIQRNHHHHREASRVKALQTPVGWKMTVWVSHIMLCDRVPYRPVSSRKDREDFAPPPPERCPRLLALQYIRCPRWLSVILAILLVVFAFVALGVIVYDSVQVMMMMRRRRMRRRRRMMIMIMIMTTMVIMTCVQTLEANLPEYEKGAERAAQRLKSALASINISLDEDL
jgi:hypothetical protein